MKKEKVYLSNHIDRVTEELEEKVPALQQLRRDYDQALVGNNNLTTKLNALFEEYETLQLESEDAVRLSKSKDREIARLKNVGHDLGRQVKVCVCVCVRACVRACVCGCIQKIETK